VSIGFGLDDIAALVGGARAATEEARSLQGASLQHLKSLAPWLSFRLVRWL